MLALSEARPPANDATIPSAATELLVRTPTAAPPPELHVPPRPRHQQASGFLVSQAGLGITKPKSALIQIDEVQVVTVKTSEAKKPPKAEDPPHLRGARLLEHDVPAAKQLP